MQKTSRRLFQERKLRGIPKNRRPRCGARTRKGTACKAQALINGRCYIHGGLSTGPRTRQGKARRRKIAREHMRAMWEKWRAENDGKPPLSDEGRKRISEAQKRRWREHRRRQWEIRVLGRPLA